MSRTPPYDTLLRVTEGNWHDSYKDKYAKTLLDVVRLHKEESSTNNNNKTTCICDQEYPCQTLKLIAESLASTASSLQEGKTKYEINHSNEEILWDIVKLHTVQNSTYLSDKTQLCTCGQINPCPTTSLIAEAQSADILNN